MAVEMVRTIAHRVKEQINQSKVLVLRATKGVGVRTILKSCLEDRFDLTYFLDLSDKNNRTLLTDFSKLKALTEKYKIVVLVHAQHLTGLQQLVDYALGLESLDNLILHCSFEPDLDEDLWDALRYQGLEIPIYPVAFSELAQFMGLVQFEKELENRLVYGMYPEVIFAEHPQEQLLNFLDQLISRHLGAGERINKSSALLKVLRALAFKVGETISYYDIAQQCGLDNETVERYIKLLEKAQLIIVLTSLYNGHRYELKKKQMVYFMDNGIRNALIQQLQQWEVRNDHEVLWKNWLISERIKNLSFKGERPQLHFWKTHTDQRVDYIEWNENKPKAYHFNWEKRKKWKLPQLFATNYSNIKPVLIQRSKYWTILS